MGAGGVGEWEVGGMRMSIVLSCQLTSFVQKTKLLRDESDKQREHVREGSVESSKVAGEWGSYVFD